MNDGPAGRGDRHLTVHAILSRAAEAGDGGSVSVADLVDAFGRRAYGPFLVILGVVMLTPAGAIPGAPLVATLLVLLLMGQSLLRHGAPWIPRRIGQLKTDGERLRGALKRAAPWVVWIDRVTGPRLGMLFEGPMPWIWSLCCILIAVTMLPLGFVPFGVAIPAASLALIGLGLMNSDGLAALAGIALAVAAGWAGFAALDSLPV